MNGACMEWTGKTLPVLRAINIIENVTSHKLCAVILAYRILFFLIWLQFTLYLTCIYDSDSMTQYRIVRIPSKHGHFLPL